MPRFAANISMLFTELPFAERYAAAVRAGFGAVECWFPYAWPVEEVARWRRDAGVSQVLINAPAGDWDAGERGLLALPGREAAFREGFDCALEYAVALDCPRINCLAGLLPDGVSRPDAIACAIENIQYAAARAARHGICCLIEPINSRDVPGYVFNTTDSALELIDAAGVDNVQLQFDIYHVQVMEGDVATRLRLLRDRIGHIQFADNPGRHEPGTGELNFDFLFGWLDRIGYQGWVAAEYIPSETTQVSLDWLKNSE